MANGHIDLLENNYQKERRARPSSNKTALQLFTDLTKPPDTQLRIIDSKIEWLIKELTDAAEKNTPDERLYAHSLSYILAFQLARNQGERKTQAKKTGGLSGKHLRDITDYIDANLGEKMSVSSLARQVGLSSHHFSHCFSESLGQSPHRYVLQRRITEATRLLKDSRLSVAEIAYELGFSSHAHFSQIYRKMTGVSPKEIRNG